MGLTCTTQVEKDARGLTLLKRSGQDVVKIAQAAAELAVLPPSFEIIPKLLLLLDDPESDNAALAEIIRVDPGLTADIIHISNTAALGTACPMEPLEEAIVRLGMRELYSAVMRVVGSPLLNSCRQQPGLERLNLWGHSLACALAAQTIGWQTGYEDAEVAFTAGLLHDVGKLILGQALGATYVSLLERSRTENRPFYSTENEVLRIDHCEAGGHLLRRWKFPERIVMAVARHHDPARATEAYQRVAAIVYTANILAYRITEGYSFPPYVAAPNPEFLRMAGLDLAGLELLEKQVQEQFAREQERFR